MKYTLILSEEAEDDIHLAFAWYEEQRTGLGIDFLNEIERSFLTIKSNPLYFGFRWPTYVALILSDFLILFCMLLRQIQ
jgi:toxin ParE1/3/4